MDYDAPPENAPETSVTLTEASEEISGGGAHDFRFGIEEEYFLADRDTMAISCETPEELFHELARRINGQGGHESLQAQMEVATAPATQAAVAREQLASLRRTAVDVAGQYGLAILASGTHPSADWAEVAHTPSTRYDKVMGALQMIGRRNMLCGMHVHVELPDPARRVDVMARMVPYIPLFIALSASSPFWRGRNTGLRGYRLAAYDELPRTGLPEHFEETSDYDRYVSALVSAGVMEDASYIWWTLRPSVKYPTLELRAPDCCTRIGDAIALACLYRVLVRHLYRNPSRNAGMSAVTRALAHENKWRAQRFGIHGSFAAEGEPEPIDAVLNAVIALTAEDAEALGCASEIAQCRSILSTGTSADNQLRVYEEHRDAGQATAIQAAAHWIAEATANVG